MMKTVYGKNLIDLTKKLQDVERSLHKGNIPGIPDEMDARLGRSRGTNLHRHPKLGRSAVKYELVNNYLENAKKSVDDRK